MNRLEQHLRAARDRGRKVLVPFLTGGHPDRETFVRLLLACQDAGADAVEVGIPFSDPSADGPVIQATSRAALCGGATVDTVLADVAGARGRGLEIPALVMTYYNPVLAAGGPEFAPTPRPPGLDTVLLVAPTTPEGRIPGVLARCTGFVYCVSVAGVTGEKRPAAETVAGLVARVRRHTDLPALVGFGVHDPAAARALAAVSDGVVVGSALLAAVGDRSGDAAVAASRSFLDGFRVALDRG